MQESKKAELEVKIKLKQQQMNKIAGLLTQLVAKKKSASKLKADKITEGIYLGCYSAACNREFLEQEGITRVLMCLGHLSPPYPESFNYKQIPVKDHENEDITKHFEEAYQFIEEGLEKKEKILVHCFAGISRSTTILTSYLIRKDRKDPQQILAFIREKRKIANPNSGFMRQLNAYYEQIKLTDPEISEQEVKAADKVEQTIETFVQQKKEQAVQVKTEQNTGHKVQQGQQKENYIQKQPEVVEVPPTIEPGYQRVQEQQIQEIKVQNKLEEEANKIEVQEPIASTKQQQAEKQPVQEVEVPHVETPPVQTQQQTEKNEEPALTNPDPEPQPTDNPVQQTEVIEKKEQVVQRPQDMEKIQQVKEQVVDKHESIQQPEPIKDDVSQPTTNAQSEAPSIAEPDAQKKQTVEEQADSKEPAEVAEVTQVAKKQKKKKKKKNQG